MSDPFKELGAIADTLYAANKADRLIKQTSAWLQTKGLTMYDLIKAIEIDLMTLSGSLPDKEESKKIQECALHFGLALEILKERTKISDR